MLGNHSIFDATNHKSSTNAFPPKIYNLWLELKQLLGSIFGSSSALCVFTERPRNKQAIHCKSTAPIDGCEPSDGEAELDGKKKLNELRECVGVSRLM